MVNTGIYKITCLANNRIYVGSAVWFDHRWRIHKSDLRLNRHGNKHLQHSWNKYGEEAFEFKILQRCKLKELIKHEQAWIDWLQPEFNILKIAGSRLGTKHTEEFKKKRSELYKGKKQPQEIVAKRAASNTGKKRTLETRLKMSNAQKGRIFTEDHLKSLSQSHLGARQSEETKAKISKAMIKIRANKSNNSHQQPVLIVESIEFK